MNPVYNPTVSSPLLSPLFASTSWACYSGGPVGISCCVSVPPYQSSLFTSSPCGIALPDLHWGCSPLSGSEVGISCCASVPPYQSSPFTSSPCAIASPDLYWGCSSLSEGQVGISHLASVPPVPYMSSILPSPPYQPTSLPLPPYGMASPGFYWGWSPLLPPDSQWGNSPWLSPQFYSLQHPFPNIIPYTTDLLTTSVVATEPTSGGEIAKSSSFLDERKLTDEARAITSVAAAGSAAAAVFTAPTSAAKASISAALASSNVPAAETDTPPAEKSELTPLEKVLKSPQTADLTDGDFQLFPDVGPRKIDVIMFRGFEYRRDRGSQKYKFNQKWVCRHANKTECKGKLKLNVRDPTKFPQDTLVTSLCDHNHEPIQSSDLPITSQSDTSMPSAHSDDDPSESEPTSLTTTKFWQLLGISQPDHDTYLAVIHVRRPRDFRERENPRSCIQP